MKFIHLLLAPALVASASSSAAEPAGQTPEMDMRCFLSASAAENVPDPKVQQMALFTTLFYLGRLSARLSDSEIETLGYAEAKAFKPENIPNLLDQCGRFMGARGNALQVLGQRLEQEAKGAAGTKK